MKTKVKKWGNSLGLRIPKSFAEETSLDNGSSVDITVKKNAIIIKPEKPVYKLEDMLSHISSKNIHKEIITEKNVGREIW